MYRGKGIQVYRFTGERVPRYSLQGKEYPGIGLQGKSTQVYRFTGKEYAGIGLQGKEYPGIGLQGKEYAGIGYPRIGNSFLGLSSLEVYTYPLLVYLTCTL